MRDPFLPRPWRRPLRVFISHTRELRDLPAERSFIAAVEAAILRAGMTVTDMAYFAARDSTPASVCAAEVAAADLVVGVLGLRYGSLVPDRPVSFTELEFDVATELGKPRLMFLLDDSAAVPLPASALIDRESGHRQDAFRSKVVGSGLIAGSFSTPDQLEMLVHQALAGHKATPARSRYLTQVRDIAPVGLARGREAELAELAAWCQGDEPYVWWQAPPWAGKSALMSTFVLDPPPRTQVVSFFVTGRLAAQADAVAFTDAVLEQLAVLTGEGVPDSLGPGQREIYRRDLLLSAAARAHASGERLVLVVDGLDEDVRGAGLPSIASLLPRQVPDGLRIVVAGRPHPDLPEDLAGDHPLRTCPRRILDLSPYAVEAARAARLELDGLLTGDPRHRELIGLVAAAGGGLTRAELRELSGLGRYEIESTLSRVCGRTLAGRTDTTLPVARRVYLFAHETLRTTAIDQLEGLLDAFHQRIHEWVDARREAGWPEDTPPYAWSGYFSMLSDLGDFPRMAALATDHVRHHRMLAVTGGDAAALAEIRAVERLLADAADPDLVTTVRLNVHRTVLADKNSHLPIDLPAVWARLGNVARAEALARGLEPARRVDALGLIAEALSRAGDDGQAKGLLAEAVVMWNDIPDRKQKSELLLRLMKHAARIGDSATRDILIRPPRASGTPLLAALESAIEHDDNKLLYRFILEHSFQIRNLTDADMNIPYLARFWAAQHGRDLIHPELPVQPGPAGDPAPVPGALGSAMSRYGQIGRRSPERWIRGLELKSAVLAEAAPDLVASGHRDQVAALAQRLRRWVEDAPLNQRPHVLRGLVPVYTRLDDEAAVTETAEFAADGFAWNPALEKNALGEFVEELGLAGRADLARSVFDQAFRFLADRPGDAAARATALGALAGVVARDGDRDAGAALARQITGGRIRGQALSSVAGAHADKGEADQASAIAVEAETSARTIDDPGQRRARTLALGVAFAVGGRADRAEKLAARLDDPEQLVLVVRALAEHGQAERAAAVAELIAPVNGRVAAAGAIARAHLAAGRPAPARTIVEDLYLTSLLEDLPGPSRADMAELAARAGLHRRAESFVADLLNRRQLSRDILDPAIAAGFTAEISAIRQRLAGQDDRGPESRAIAALVGALTRAGDRERAVALTSAMPRFGDQSVMAEMLSGLVRCGQSDDAEFLVEAPHSGLDELVGLSALAVATAAAGLHARALRLGARADQALAESLASGRRISAIVPALTVERDGDFERAESMMPKLEPAQQQIAWFELAKVATRGGHTDRVEAIARDHAFTDASHLRGVIVMVAEGRDFERAERMAHDLVPPAQLPGVLAELAVRLASTSDQSARRRRVRRLLAEALHLGPWTECVEALARVDFELVLEIDRRLSLEIGE
ncbi:DUF4062 domain-containing protein [Actinoplanes sp. TRM 88003]|uniref:DUF4062 domain-containing protein n=1 Tax=Paractinoplanes aksuensis TaxID=2939490 RepID=A0ABT1DYJ3_9ACTN|nr:DUF4062 domain-containing protein [Actinoplanes aksuensis]MCO8275956.1 DUF4062 domain-containing protein [Actinoplanes aksuensis]